MPETPSHLSADADAARVDQLARDILHEGYKSFVVDELTLRENDKVQLTVRLKASNDGAAVVVDGEGVGLVDAFFDGAMKAWSSEYASLKTVVVVGFQLGAEKDGGKGRRSDADAVATLRMKNSHDQVFTFESRSPSVTRSSVRVALDAVSFFINAERAWVQLQLAIKDATERRRSDLVARYRGQMATLVLATSYEALKEGE